jgi:hypothetical protein
VNGLQKKLDKLTANGEINLKGLTKTLHNMGVDNDNAKESSVSRTQREKNLAWPLKFTLILSETLSRTYAPRNHRANDIPRKQ